ncbi:MAG: alpha/beta hydrolase, partial [Gemmatimonadales bacterium]
MMRLAGKATTAGSAALALVCIVALPRISTAQDTLRPPPIPLWSAAAPGALGTSPADMPTISVYRPADGTATGAAIVICPGGAYQALADHEGHDVAVWLRGLGVTAIVLKYRLGPRYHYPAPMLDAARAMRTVRAHAADWGIDTARIGSPLV